MYIDYTCDHYRLERKINQSYKNNIHLRFMFTVMETRYDTATEDGLWFGGFMLPVCDNQHAGS